MFFNCCAADSLPSSETFGLCIALRRRVINPLGTFLAFKNLIENLRLEAASNIAGVLVLLVRDLGLVVELAVAQGLELLARVLLGLFRDVVVVQSAFGLLSGTRMPEKKKDDLRRRTHGNRRSCWPSRRRSNAPL